MFPMLYLKSLLFGIGGAVLAETGLSFFGFGVQPPDVSLGTLIQEGTPSALTFWWIFLFPGLLLILAVPMTGFEGDRLVTRQQVLRVPADLEQGIGTSETPRQRSRWGSPS